MEARVLKNFTTPTRRFIVGQLVVDFDLADDPLGMIARIDRGFLSPGSALMPPPPVVPDQPAVLSPMEPEADDKADLISKEIQGKAELASKQSEEDKPKK